MKECNVSATHAPNYIIKKGEVYTKIRNVGDDAVLYKCLHNQVEVVFETDRIQKWFTSKIILAIEIGV